MHFKIIILNLEYWLNIYKYVKHNTINQNILAELNKRLDYDSKYAYYD